MISSIYTYALANKPKSFTLYSEIKFPEYIKLPFHLLDLVGQGSSSKVYRAKTIEKDSKIVAVKIIDNTDLNVQKEVLILKNLKSTNIIRLYDAFRHLKKIYLVFEFVDILPIALTGNERLIEINFIMYQLLKVLQFCHSNGIMHCDIKPSNIGLGFSEIIKTGSEIIKSSSEIIKTTSGISRFKSLKLIDFGHAQFYWPDNSYCPSVGTITYRAPELLFESKHFSYAVDIWSAGIIFLQLLAPKEAKKLVAKTNEEQILNLNENFGTDTVVNFCRRYNFTCYKLPHRDGNLIASLKTTDKDLELALDLLDKMLQIDPANRITSSDALNHPFIKC